MVNQEILNVLESLGLHKNEIIVYLDLIKAGKSSALEISKRTHLHRSNTYDILEQLFEKGIVDQTIENNKKIFYPIAPEDLLDYLKQKEKELEKVLPEIEKIYNYPEEKRRVTISEGINSVKNILIHLIDLKEPIFCFQTNKIFENLQGFLGEFHRARIKRKIPLKCMFESKITTNIKHLNKMDYTEIKYLSTDNENLSTIICGDKVVIIIWSEPIETIIIQSKFVSKSFQNYFQYLWSEAKTLGQIYKGV
jgi:sugar-specific transcriptional regulator TrmB